MKVVGLTGGIGSGKTTVAGFFRELGVPVYIADDEAKNLMAQSSEISDKIKKHFGNEMYLDGVLNRGLLASKVFNDKKELETLNGIVHPEVEKHFEAWKEKQASNYVVYEAAILFEKGSYKKCDYTILVTAELETRVNRLKKRDKASEEEIKARMSNQWADDKKRELADFEIVNMNLFEARQQVRKFHQILVETA